LNPQVTQKTEHSLQNARIRALAGCLVRRHSCVQRPASTSSVVSAR